MPVLYGGLYDRDDLCQHVGDISQVASVRSVRLQDGPEDGVRALEFRTGSGLEFDVISDRGFDISRASYNGRSLAWRSPCGDQHPSFYDPEGAGWLRTFAGGLLTTCGLAQAGSPNVDNGEELGLHGRVSHVPARDVAVLQGWQGDDYLLQARGAVRECAVFGDNITLTRVITSTLGSKKLRIQDAVANESPDPRPHMILYHMNFGFPVVAEGSAIHAPTLQSNPRDAAAEEEAEQWMRMKAPTGGFAERVYLHEMRPDDEGYVTVALVNEDFPGGPFGIWIRYASENLPCFTEWKMNGRQTYVCGLEPGNCYPLGRAAERAAGRLVTLEPGEERVYEIEAGVIDGEDDYHNIRELITYRPKHA